MEVRIINKDQFQLWLGNAEVLRRASIYFVHPAEKRPEQSPCKTKMTHLSRYRNNLWLVDVQKELSNWLFTVLIGPRPRTAPVLEIYNNWTWELVGTAYHVCSQFLDKKLSTLLYVAKIASSIRRAIRENAETFIVNAHLLRIKIHWEYFYLLKLKSVKYRMSVRVYEHLYSLLVLNAFFVWHAKLLYKDCRQVLQTTFETHIPPILHCTRH